MTKSISQLSKRIKKKFLQTAKTKNACFNINPYKILDWENTYVLTRDSVKIGVWIIKAANPKGCLIFLHGSSSNRARFTRGLKLDRFVAFGYTIVVPDYREFGDSDGVFEVDTVNYDIEAVHNYCLTQIDANPVIIGFSLGGAIALEYCKFAKFKNKVILISTFSNTKDILNDNWVYRTAKIIMPYIEIEMITSFNYNSTENISMLEPDQVFIIHGEKDNKVTIEHSKKLIEKVACQYHFFKDDDHVSIMKNEKLINVIEEFLNLDK